jgi:O-6-methylguanine DNA methyltransferase
VSNYFSYYNSPIGLLELKANEEQLLQALFVTEKDKAEYLNPVMLNAHQQLKEYFDGKRRTFDLPLHIQSTAFTEYVWKQLLNIPFGEALSYKKFAEQIGNSKATRAIGTANGKNQFMIIIPCHRVLGSNGGLVGYAGGLDKKHWLLHFEAKASGKILF